MITICAHSSDPFNNNLFGEDKEPTFEQKPTFEQIKKYRLWKCPTCGKWYSLIGIAKTAEGN